MSIETSLEECLRALGRESEVLVGKALAPLGITLRQYEALTVVADLGPIISGQVADVTGTGAGSMQYVLMSMCGRGWMVRRDAIEGAHVNSKPFTVTADGLRMLAKCRKALDGVNRDIQRYFPEPVVEALAAAYVSLLVNYDRPTEHQTEETE